MAKYGFEVFESGAPVTGLTPTAIAFFNQIDGQDVSSPPVPVEDKLGFYTLTHTVPLGEIHYARFDFGATVSDEKQRYQAIMMRPEDDYLQHRIPAGAGASL